MSGIIRWIRDNYGEEIEIFVTENGFPDYGDIDDVDRVRYYKVIL